METQDKVNIALIDQYHYTSYTMITYILSELSDYLLEEIRTHNYVFLFPMQL